MRWLSSRRLLSGGAAFLSVAASVALALGMLVSLSSVSVAQVQDIDKVKIEKFGALVSGNVEFTIRVTTVSPHQIDGVQVTDNLPNSGITWSLVESDPTCSVTGAVGSQVLSCDFGTLHGELGVQTRSARVRGVLSAGRCGDIENTATVRVATAEGETVLSNNTATAKVTVPCGGEGCTPGFWRNHLGDWAATGYSTGNDFDATFGVDLFNPNITLGQAVVLGGGGVNVLARHGVAALLSAAHPQVDYPYSVAQVIAFVQAGNVAPLVAANELGCTIP